jgi:hypothetical protein
LLALLLVVFLLRRAKGDIGSWTPEHIAYVLLVIVARAEQKALNKTDSGAIPIENGFLMHSLSACGRLGTPTSG